MLNQGLATGPTNDPFGIRPKSVFEQFSAQHLYLADQMAKSRQQGIGLDSMFAAAANGITPDDLDKQSQQEAIAFKAQDLANETLHLDDKKFNEFQTQLSKEVSAPTPLPKQADLNAPSPLLAGLAALVGVLDPGSAFDAAQGVFQGGINERDRQTKLNYENYNIQENAHQNKIRGLGQLADNEQTRMAQQERQFNNDRSVKLNVLEMQQRSLDRSEQVKGTKLEKAWAKYYSANLEGEKRTAAATLRQLDPDFAPTKAAEDADIKAMVAQKRGAAAREAEQYVKRYSADGVVNDSDQGAIQAEFRRIEDAYGLKAGDLGEVPTFKSLAKQKAEDLKQQWKDKFTFTKQVHKDNMANAKANRDLAAQRLKVMQQMGYDRISYGFQADQYRYEMQRYNASVKGLNGESQAALIEMDKKMAGVRSAMEGTADETKKASLKVQLDKLTGERSFIEQQISPEIPFGIGGQTAPNPNYHEAPTPPQAPEVKPFNPLSGEITKAGVKKGKPPKKGLPSGWKFG
jgi:hypothetical protein